MRVRVHLGTGPQKGYPLLTEEDKAKIPGPDARYDETDTAGRAKNNMHLPQPKMPFIRSGAAEVASVGCKKRNHYPVVTKLLINGKMHTFSTIPQCTYTFWIRFRPSVASVLACILNVYLHAHCMRTCVGITGIFKRNVFPDHTNWHTRSCCISSTGLTGRKTIRTSNCSNCCTFVFAVGTAHHVCRYPIIKAIHLKLTNDRRRFAKVIVPAFEEWFQLLRDKPELQKFMQDGGKGKPPAEYLWKVEKGLRNLGRMSVSLYLTNLLLRAKMVIITCVLVF